MSEGAQRLLSPADDDLHQPDGSRWFHETWWFWFFVPERSLGGWVYSYARPNIGVSGGGCWVWDATTFLHWEAPYYANHSALSLPETHGPGHVSFPSGVTIEALEPLQRYAIRYADEPTIAVDLEFDAVMAPWVRVAPDEVPPRPVHLDQLGRITGSVILHGETLAVDCLAIRDRTWTARSERWRDGGGYGYTNAAASPDLAFLAVGDAQQVRGYLVQDGVRCELSHGRRRVERHASHGYVTRVRIDATDLEGRTVEADGVPASRMAMPIPGVHGVVWTSFVEWTVNGVPAWGEDQEPWPIMAWSQRRRARGG
ncbi:MAG: hypothetical protein ABIY48_13460 [Acidimicrobiales bacterium]